MNMGWICPRCAAVHSPDIRSCQCPNTVKATPYWPVQVPLPQIPNTLYPMPICGCTGPCCNSACPHLGRATCQPNIALTGGVN